MKLYFAGSDCGPGYNTALLKAGATCRLESFHAVGLARAPSQGFKHHILDSGAFSAFTLGKLIKLDEYCDYLTSYIKQLDRYIVLDAIGDPSLTQENQRTMEKRGLRPLPVIHYGASHQALVDACKNYDYFCLGGLVPYARQKTKLVAFLDFAFNIIREFFPVKVHLLGIKTQRILERYPVYSADSTSWLAPARYGNMQHTSCALTSLYKAKTNHYLLNVEREAEYWVKYERQVTQIWAMRGIKWED